MNVMIVTRMVAFRVIMTLVDFRWLFARSYEAMKCVNKEA